MRRLACKSSESVSGVFLNFSGIPSGKSKLYCDGGNSIEIISIMILEHHGQAFSELIALWSTMVAIPQK